MITRLAGISNVRVKFFSHDGGISQADFTALELEVNTWISLNPTAVIYDIEYELIERVQPSPDLYTKTVMVTYR